jgi:hypothetical protein
VERSLSSQRRLAFDGNQHKPAANLLGAIALYYGLSHIQRFPFWRRASDRWDSERILVGVRYMVIVLWLARKSCPRGTLCGPRRRSFFP